MAFFNWFSGKSGTAKPMALADAGVAARSNRPVAARGAVPAAASRPVPDPTDRSEERKAKRHTRREQLYVAVRESMTRAGVLSSSFKFKVLSLDQRGDQFLVMMDVHPSMGAQVEKLSECEALIIQTAKTLFAIAVTSVYWRLDTKAEHGFIKTAAAESRPAPLEPSPPAAQAVKRPAGQRYEPIQDDEVNAFKQALMAASAQHPSPAPDASGKTRSGLRSYTLITGFEDTEMPESSAAPALSATQYGELR
jgi:hypothetical protein